MTDAQIICNFFIGLSEGPYAGKTREKTPESEQALMLSYNGDGATGENTKMMSTHVHRITESSQNDSGWKGPKGHLVPSPLP